MHIFIFSLSCRTFHIKSRQTKIFATQNPYREGSGRKGLPKSFLNRFVKVFVAPLVEEDVRDICAHRQVVLFKQRGPLFTVVPHLMVPFARLNCELAVLLCKIVLGFKKLAVGS